SNTCLDIENMVGMIHDGPELVELIVGRVKVLQRSEVGVPFACGGPFIIEVVGGTKCGNELEVFRPAPGLVVHNWIQDEVPFAQMCSDNWSDLRGEAPGFPVCIVEAELEINSIHQRVVFGMRPDEQLTYLESVERTAASLGVRRVDREVKALL